MASDFIFCVRPKLDTCLITLFIGEWHQLCGTYYSKCWAVISKRATTSLWITSTTPLTWQKNCSQNGTLWLVWGASRSLQNLARNRSLARGEMAFRKKANTFVLCWQDIRLASFIIMGYDVTTKEFIHRQQQKRGGTYMYKEVMMQRPKLVQQYVNYMVGFQSFWSAD